VATMFGFRKRSAPPLRSSNPGIGVEGKVAFARGDRSWTEEFNTVTLAASALKERGYAVSKERPGSSTPTAGSFSSRNWLNCSRSTTAVFEP